ncbi:hypothetical protein [Crenobacter intestini]|uniref:Uncharacterized protein n=1 Tax=Crenobacter intestini TaxID=2563443 RepID=A0A4T0UP65_9NEIS|nr:hypothetical protein [Crenobacter intestini]TIC80538.1 hypothetical protein E5K04_11945 [Crenobacter intestini]
MDMTELDATHFINSMNEMFEDSFIYYSSVSPSTTPESFSALLSEIGKRDALDPDELYIKSIEVAKIKNREMRLSELTLSIERGLIHGLLAFDYMSKKDFGNSFNHALHFRSLLTCVKTILLLDEEISDALKRKMSRAASAASMKSKDVYFKKKEAVYDFIRSEGVVWSTVEAAANFVDGKININVSEKKVSFKSLKTWIADMPDREKYIERKSRRSK